MPECINLADIYEHFYQIRFEEGYTSKNVPQNKLDPWKMIIPCKYGAITPAGGKLLAWYCEGHPKKRNLVKALQCVIVAGEGDRDLTVHFDITDFDVIKEIVLPKRRPGVPAAEREKRSIRMRIRNRAFPIKTQIPEAPGRFEEFPV